MFFSVIVPTYNRLQLLKQTLQSLFDQTIDTYEIIVVNDGSTDGSHEYLSEMAGSRRIRYFHHPNSGLAATRSLGLRFASGTHVAFTDDDCIVPRDWLEKLSADFRDQEAAGIGGPTRTGNPSNLYAEANDFINNYFKFALSRSGVPYLTGNNVAYTRKILDEVGGPDPRFRMGAEDRDLLYRVSRQGRIHFDPSLVVEHFNDARFFSYARHQFEQGVGSYLYYTLNRRLGEMPPPIPARLYWGLVRHAFSTRPLGRAISLVWLIVLAQVCVLAGFLFAASGATGRKEGNH